MAGVNPTAAGASANAVEAAIALELQALAADAQALRELLIEGDVVQATVQPFNGITDTLEIMGLRVAASLPPDVLPGETLTVAVQGFNGDQVLVQVLSRTPSSSGATAETASTPTTSSQADSLELTRTPIPIVVDEQPAQTAAQQIPAQQTPAQIPARQAPMSQAPVQSSEAEPPAPVLTSRAESPAAVTAFPPPPKIAIAQQTDASIRPENFDVEARVALARTAGFRALRSPNAPPAQNAPPPAQGNAPVQPRPAAAAAGAMAAPPARAAMPPLPSAVQAQSQAQAQTQAQPPAAPAAPAIVITPRAPGAKPPPAPLPGAPTEMRIARILPASPRAVVAANAAELINDPPALLRTLRIPVTPTTLTFAKLVTTQPEQVAIALRALEASLFDNADPRITAMRTLAGFVGTLDPQSPTFTTQVVSYITHVIEGPEQKLLPLVLPQAVAAPAPSAEQQPATQAQFPAQPPAQAPAQPPSASEDPSVTAARVVERVAAADADLKTQLIGTLASPQAETTLGEAGVAVARNALTALVATQLNALVAQQAQPGAWTLTVPITIEQQLYPAKIEISRDKGEGKAKDLSSDDFHIVFILDTKRLGTVAVDVHAARRAVSVSVRTERTTAAATFKAALKNLGARLEGMRYNVKSLDAAATASKPPPPPPSDPLTTTDQHA